MNTKKPPRAVKRQAFALILISLFTVISPILFLSSSHDGQASVSDMPDQFIRVGEPFANIVFSNVSNTAKPDGIRVLQVEGSKFGVELPNWLPSDDMDAIAEAVASPEVQQTYSGATRLHFDGWLPSFLPIRIPYRYFLIVGFALFLVGAWLFFVASQERQDD